MEYTSKKEKHTESIERLGGRLALVLIKVNHSFHYLEIEPFSDTGLY